MTDADNPPLDAGFWKDARPLNQTVPQTFFDGMKKLGHERRKKLGLAKTAGPSISKPTGRPALGDRAKAIFTLRLDPDVIAGIRATGRGYNGRVEELLRTALAKRRL